MIIRFLDTRCTLDHLGLIPSFLDEEDERPASEQFDERYSHGGGWRPMKGWEMGPTSEIRYKGDRDAMRPIAVIAFREELIYIYPYAWVAIVQPDGSFEVSRMD